MLLRKNKFFSSPKTSQQSVRKPYRPLLSIQFSLGGAREGSMLEKGVTVLHDRGKKAYDQQSCAQDKDHHSIESEGLMEIYSL